MRLRTLLFKCLLPCCIAVLVTLECGTQISEGPGTGSETTNGFTASVAYPNGKHVAHAKVRLRPSDYLADTAGGLYKAGIVKYDTVTDDSGRLQIDSVAIGRYTIEISDTAGNAAAVACTASVNTIINLGALAALPMRTIEGSITSTINNDLFARVYGLERCVTVNSSGHFSIKIPVSLYCSMKISSPDTSIDILVDTTKNQGDTVYIITDLGNFRGDSLAVRMFLDSCGLQGIAVSAVTVIDTSANRIRRLELRNRGLKTVPPVIGTLSFLWAIDLTGNSLSDLPQEIATLPLLSNLVLDSTALRELPTAVTNCTRLCWLSLNATGIRDLPQSVARLSALTDIDLNDDSLTTVPAVITDLAKLKSLGLARNRLTTLPESIGKLTALEYLHIDGNLIDSIPVTIGYCAALKVIYAYENRLTTLPSSIGELKSLSYLNLERNLIFALPDRCSDLESLSELYLDNNMLSTFPSSMVQLKIKQGSIGSNRLCSVSDTIATWLDSWAEPKWNGQQICP